MKAEEGLWRRWYLSWALQYEWNFNRQSWKGCGEKWKEHPGQKSIARNGKSSLVATE